MLTAVGSTDGSLLLAYGCMSGGIAYEEVNGVVCGRRGVVVQFGCSAAVGMFSEKLPLICAAVGKLPL